MASFIHDLNGEHFHNLAVVRVNARDEAGA
jgi:hypothetical protein